MSTSFDYFIQRLDKELNKRDLNLTGYFGGVIQSTINLEDFKSENLDVSVEHNNNVKNFVFEIEPDEVTIKFPLDSGREIPEQKFTIPREKYDVDFQALDSVCNEIAEVIYTHLT